MRDDQKEFFEIMSAMKKLNLSSVLGVMTHPEFATMKVIHSCCDNGKTRVSDIVNKLRVPAPAVSRNLRTLEKKGFIDRTVDRNDRRNTFVIITPEGEREYRKTMKEIDAFAESVFAQMGENSAKQMNAYFRQLLDAAELELDKRRKKKGE